MRSLIGNIKRLKFRRRDESFINNHANTGRRGTVNLFLDVLRWGPKVTADFLKLHGVIIARIKPTGWPCIDNARSALRCLFFFLCFFSLPFNAWSVAALLSRLKMTGIAQVAADLNERVWPTVYSGRNVRVGVRKCYFPSSEMEKSQVRRHVHTGAINGDDGKPPNAKWHGTPSMALLEQIL